MGGTEENSVSPRSGHRFALKAKQRFLTHPAPLVFDCLGLPERRHGVKNLGYKDFVQIKSSLIPDPGVYVYLHNHQGSGNCASTLLRLTVKEM